MKPVRTEVMPNGQSIEFMDCIHHTTTTKFPFWQRVKHLFGAPVVIKSEIYCEKIPGSIIAKSKGLHTRIFPKKSKGKGIMLGPESTPEPSEVKGEIEDMFYLDCPSEAEKYIDHIIDQFKRRQVDEDGLYEEIEKLRYKLVRGVNRRLSTPTKNQEWISVDEKHPEKDGAYLIRFKNKNKEDGILLVDCAVWDGEKWGARFDSWERVLEWMPMPE